MKNLSQNFKREKYKQKENHIMLSPWALCTSLSLPFFLWTGFFLVVIVSFWWLNMCEFWKFLIWPEVEFFWCPTTLPFPPKNKGHSWMHWFNRAFFSSSAARRDAFQNPDISVSHGSILPGHESSTRTHRFFQVKLFPLEGLVKP